MMHLDMLHAAESAGQVRQNAGTLMEHGEQMVKAVEEKG